MKKTARARALAKNLSIDNPKNQKCKSVYLADGTRERVLHVGDGNDELCVCLFLCVCVCVCVDVFASCASAGLIGERRINLCSRTKTRLFVRFLKGRKSVRSASHEKKEEKQLQTRGEKDKGVSLSLCVSVFHDLIIFTLAAFVFLDRSVTVSQVSVLFVCRFRAPFFSQIV